MRAAVADALFELALADDRVVFIGSDLGAGTMEQMRLALPDRFFMEGVSEQYIVGMAAGLALDGYMPFVCSIATFITRRCYEQICIDVCLHELPVRLVGNGGGAVYGSLGPTHVANDDLAIMRACRNLTVLAPGDRPEACDLLRQTADLPGPVYLRLGPPGPPDLPQRPPAMIGELALLRRGADVALISLAAMTSVALTAADLLAAQGIAATVVHVHSLVPFPGEALREAITGAPLVVTMEEHGVLGGLGSAVSEVLSDVGAGSRVRRLGLPSGALPGSSPREDMLAVYGLTPEGVASTVARELGTVQM